MAGCVRLDDALMVCEIEAELGRIGRPALIRVDEFVTFLTRTLETAFLIDTRLIAEAPFFTLVSICVSDVTSVG